MAKKYKYPDSYKWLDSNNRTDINERFTERQLKYLLKHYTEIEIADLCDRWFMLFDHPEYGLITYHELLHKRIQEIQSENIAFSDLDKSKLNLDKKRIEMLNIGREKVANKLTDLIAELEDLSLPDSKIVTKKIYLIPKLNDLRFAFFEDTEFLGLEFRNFRFEGAYLTNSFFKFCRFGKTNLSATDCNSSSFNGSIFINTALANSECHDSDFSFTRMEGIYFNNSNLTKSDFKRSNIYGVFNHADCSYADFRGTIVKQMHMFSTIFDNIEVGEVIATEQNGESRSFLTTVNFMTYDKNSSFKNIDISQLKGNAVSIFIRYINGESINEKDLAYYYIHLANIFSRINFGIRKHVPSFVKYLVWIILILYVLYIFQIFLIIPLSIKMVFPVFFSNYLQQFYIMSEELLRIDNNSYIWLFTVVAYFCYMFLLALVEKRVPTYLTFAKSS